MNKCEKHESARKSKKKYSQIIAAITTVFTAVCIMLFATVGHVYAASDGTQEADFDVVVSDYLIRNGGEYQVVNDNENITLVSYDENHEATNHETYDSSEYKIKTHMIRADEIVVSDGTKSTSLTWDENTDSYFLYDQEADRAMVLCNTVSIDDTSIPKNSTITVDSETGGIEVAIAETRRTDSETLEFGSDSVIALAGNQVTVDEFTVIPSETASVDVEETTESDNEEITLDADETTAVSDSDSNSATENPTDSADDVSDSDLDSGSDSNSDSDSDVDADQAIAVPEYENVLLDKTEYETGEIVTAKLEFTNPDNAPISSVTVDGVDYPLTVTSNTEGVTTGTIQLTAPETVGVAQQAGSIEGFTFDNGVNTAEYVDVTDVSIQPNVTAKTPELTHIALDNTVYEANGTVRLGLEFTNPDNAPISTVNVGGEEKPFEETSNGDGTTIGTVGFTAPETVGVDQTIGTIEGFTFDNGIESEYAGTTEWLIAEDIVHEPVVLTNVSYDDEEYKPGQDVEVTLTFENPTGATIETVGINNGTTVEQMPLEDQQDNEDGTSTGTITLTAPVEVGADQEVGQVTEVAYHDGINVGVAGTVAVPSSDEKSPSSDVIVDVVHEPVVLTDVAYKDVQYTPGQDVEVTLTLSNPTRATIEKVGVENNGETVEYDFTVGLYDEVNQTTTGTVTLTAPTEVGAEQLIGEVTEVTYHDGITSGVTGTVVASNQGVVVDIVHESVVLTEVAYEDMQYTPGQEVEVTLTFSNPTGATIENIEVSNGTSVEQMPLEDQQNNEDGTSTGTITLTAPTGVGADQTIGQVTGFTYHDGITAGVKGTGTAPNSEVIVDVVHEPVELTSVLYGDAMYTPGQSVEVTLTFSNPTGATIERVGVENNGVIVEYDFTVEHYDEVNQTTTGTITLAAPTEAGAGQEIGEITSFTYHDGITAGVTGTVSINDVELIVDVVHEAVVLTDVAYEEALYTPEQEVIVTLTFSNPTGATIEEIGVVKDGQTVQYGFTAGSYDEVNRTTTGTITLTAPTELGAGQTIGTINEFTYNDGITSGVAGTVTAANSEVKIEVVEAPTLEDATVDKEEYAVGEVVTVTLVFTNPHNGVIETVITNEGEYEVTNQTDNGDGTSTVTTQITAPTTSSKDVVLETVEGFTFDYGKSVQTKEVDPIDLKAKLVYIPITNATELQAIETDPESQKGDPSAVYRVKEDIDINEDSEITDFDPIDGFKATFDGGGFSITSYNSTTNGLFASTTDSAVINNVNIEGVVNCSSENVGLLVGNNGGIVNDSSATGTVTGGGDYVGGLVGVNKGEVNYSSATGEVIGIEPATGPATVPVESTYVGGLVGINEGKVNDSSATGSVTGTENIGGLVGVNVGQITNSFATGPVTGTGIDVGGLVGVNEGKIINSFATGPVTGTENVGGLVGVNKWEITDSYATGVVNGGGDSVGGLVGWSIVDSNIAGCYAEGAVRGNNSIGGLVGNNEGTINNSSATGAVRGNNSIGGLVGNNVGTVNNSSATGSVTGSENLGGFVGVNYWEITNSYATGVVDGGNNVGGFAGSNNKSVSNSYAIGTVSGDTNVGGFVGYNRAFVSNSYAIGPVTGNEVVGGFIGYNKAFVSNSYAIGPVTGNEVVGGFAGFNDFRIENSFATGSVIGDLGAKGFVGTNEYMIENSYAYQYQIVNGDAVGYKNELAGTGGTNNVATYDELCTSDWHEDLLGTQFVTNPGYYPHVLYSNTEDALEGQEIWVPVGEIPVLISADLDKSEYAVGEEATVSLEFASTEILDINIESVKVSGEDYHVINETENGDGTSTVTIQIEAPMSSGLDMDVGIVEGFTYSDGTNLQTQDVYPLILTADLVYIPITNATDLQDINSNTQKDDPEATFRVMNDIDCSEYSDFDPIDDFGATFDGQGYLITGYTSMSNGLFASTTGTAEIVNVHIDGSTVNSMADDVGLLVGCNNGSINNSYATGSVTGDSNVGGLVGYNSSGTITNSHTKGSVNGVRNVGGLVGFNNSAIENSYAAVSVTGSYYVGGLVGDNLKGTIKNSYATGAVVGDDDYVGGLVGRHDGVITNCYATGTVIGNDDYIGGLVGSSKGDINRSYAIGDVSGDHFVGGLVGDDNGLVENSYATGDLTGDGNVGGLAGKSDGAIENSYAYEGQIINEVPVDSSTDGSASDIATYEELCTSNWQEVLLGDQFVSKAGYYPQVLDSNTREEVPDQPLTEIKKKNPITEVTVEGLKSVDAGSTGDYEANVSGKGYFDSSVTWKVTGNTSAETVIDENGILTVGKDEMAASVTVTATSVQDDTKAGEMTVTINPVVAGIEITSNPAGITSVATGVTVEYNATVTGYGNIEQGGVTWSVSPLSSGDTISSSGHLVTDSDNKSDRTVTVTATSNMDPSKSASTTLQVDDSSSDVKTFDYDNNMGPSKYYAGYGHSINVPDSSSNSTNSIRVHFDNAAQDMRFYYDSDFSNWEGYQTFVNSGEYNLNKENDYELGWQIINAYGPNIWMCDSKGGMDSGEAWNYAYEEVGLVSTGDGNANDRMSSLYIEYLPPNTTITFYEHANYTGEFWSYSSGESAVTNTKVEVPAEFDNMASSYKVAYNENNSVYYNVNPENPTIPIYNVEELQGIEDHPEKDNPDATFVLMNDIDCYSIDNFNPINNFGATFDGQDYSITGYNSTQNGLFASTNSTAVIENVHIDGTVNSSSNCVGLLVGDNDGTVKNSNVTGAVTGTDNYVGGLVGFNSGTIDNCYTIGNVSGGDQYIGGLVGSNNYGIIINSYATGSVSGGDIVGGLVGSNHYGTVKNSYATGTVTGTTDIGGLVGYNSTNGTIENSYATGEVCGSGSYTGGLVGLNASATIENCYATGNVNGHYDVGGLVGRNYENNNLGTIENSYATGSVTGDTNAGGLVGYFESGAIESSYAYEHQIINGVLVDEDSDGSATGIESYENLCDSTWQETLLGSNFGYKTGYYPHLLNSNTGEPVSGQDVLVPILEPQKAPVLKTENLDKLEYATGEVATATLEFINPYNTVIETVKVSGVDYTVTDQTNNGDGTSTVKIKITAPTTSSTNVLIGTIEGFAYNDGTSSQTVEIDPRDLVADLVYIPITNADELQGIGGHAQRYDADAVFRVMNDIDCSGIADFDPIYNFGATFDGQEYSITGYNSTTNGLFDSTTSTAVIENVHIEGTVNSSHSYVGLLVGENEGTVKNSNAIGDVTVTGTSDFDYVGGLVGFNRGTIDNCYTTVTVSGANNYIGGLVGSNHYGTVKDSYATGSVNGGDIAGGLVGSNYYGTVKNSYATGSVTGSTDIGGLVGLNDRSTIENSYATGDVFGSDSYVGGLVGLNMLATTENCYATGDVYGYYCVGGLVGRNFENDNPGTIKNTYATGSVTGYKKAGGLVGYFESGTIESSYAYEHQTINGVIVDDSTDGSATGIAKYDNLCDSVWQEDLLGSHFEYKAGHYPRVLDEDTGEPISGQDVWIPIDSSHVKPAIISADFAKSEYAVGEAVTVIIEFSNPNNAVIETVKVSEEDYPVTSQKDSGDGTSTVTIQIIAETSSDKAMLGTIEGFTYNNGTTSQTIEISPIELRLESVYIPISNATELQNIDNHDQKDDANAIFRVMDDIVIPSGTNFDPIDNFAATFDGQSHSITGYESTINGLFASTTDTAVIEDIHVQGNLTSSSDNVGLLVGKNAGKVKNSSATATGTVTGTSYVGGLVGYNSVGTIENSYASNEVSGNTEVGGLVGFNEGEITGCYATGNVTGGDYTGGLVGDNTEGSVTDSYATGFVTGGHFVGGLVGFNVEGTINNSYATGNVSGEYNTGGLVGENVSGFIENSYATGSVTGDKYVGGLVASNDGEINNCYASGIVTGTATGEFVGGLVGNNKQTIKSCYATGNVTGNNNYVGGLVGNNPGTIESSYATGNVTGNNNFVGGFAGNNVGHVANSYATGDVSGFGNHVGALAGGNVGIILNSYAYQFQLINGVPLDDSTSGDATAIADYENLCDSKWQEGLFGYGFKYVEGYYPHVIDSNNTKEVPGQELTEIKHKITITEVTVTGSDSVNAGSTSDYEASVSGIGSFDSSVTWSLTGNTSNGTTIDPNGLLTVATDESAASITISATSVQDNTMVDQKEVTVNPPITDVTVTGPESVYVGYKGDYEAKVSSTGDFDSSVTWTVAGNTSARTVIDENGLLTIGEDEKAANVTVTATSVQDITKSGTMTVAVIPSVVYIYDANDLQKLDTHPSKDDPNVTFKVMNDIDCSSNQNFDPIDGFGATFDGQGYTISNYKSMTNGLFESTSSSAVIKNVNMANVNVTPHPTNSMYNKGGLVGVNHGTIQNCTVSGIVYNNTHTAGGIVGHNFGTIENTYSTATVKGADNVGGIAGINEGGTIENCTSNGNITGNSAVGGIVGYMNDGGTVTGSRATHVITGKNNNVGGLVGYAENSTISDSNTECTTDGKGTYTGGLVGNAQNTTITNSYTKGYVNGAIGTGGLVGILGGGTIDNSHSEMEVRGAEATGGLVGHSGGAITNSYATNMVNSIGSKVGGLVGLMTGGGSITDSYATCTVHSNVKYVGGLVGYVENGVITGSYATGNVTGVDYVGGLIGTDYNGGASQVTVKDCYATGSVSGRNSVGSFAGDLSNSNINSCYAEGTATGSYSVGGFVGAIWNNVTITDCYATGKVTGHHDVGGLVGYQTGSLITNSYATGNVEAQSSRAGGLVGTQNGGTISKTYATGDATVHHGYNAGGLVGVMEANSTIEYSYATGDCWAYEDSAGGLVGYINGANCRISQTYATGNVDTHHNSGNKNSGGLYGGANSNAWIGNSFAYEYQIVEQIAINDNNDHANGIATYEQLCDTVWQTNQLGSAFIYNAGCYPVVVDTDTGQQLGGQEELIPIRASATSLSMGVSEEITEETIQEEVPSTDEVVTEGEPSNSEELTDDSSSNIEVEVPSTEEEGATDRVDEVEEVEEVEEMEEMDEVEEEKAA